MTVRSWAVALDRERSCKWRRFDKSGRVVGWFDLMIEEMVRVSKVKIGGTSLDASGSPTRKDPWASDRQTDLMIGPT